jgi:sugar phosphate isomerase/epimerase
MLSVMDRVLLSASRANLEACIELALDYNLGIEVMAFAFPDLLDGDWQGALAEHKKLLRPINGLLTVHGPFFDMAPGSPDPQIKQITVERYQHAIRIASELRRLSSSTPTSSRPSTTSVRVGWHKRNLVGKWRITPSVMAAAGCREYVNRPHNHH